MKNNTPFFSSAFNCQLYLVVVVEALEHLPAGQYSALIKGAILGEKRVAPLLNTPPN